MYKITIRKGKRRRCGKLEMFRDLLHFKGTIAKKDVVILSHKRSLSTGDRDICFEKKQLIRNAVQCEIQYRNKTDKNELMSESRELALAFYKAEKILLHLSYKDPFPIAILFR